MKKILTYLVLITMFLGLLYVVRLFFMPEYEKALYGNRLEGIESVENTNVSALVESLLGSEITTKVDSRIQGKIININVLLSETSDLKAFKTKLNEDLNLLTDEVKAYYDIQVFVTKELEESKDYSIGYKNKLTASVVWTD